MFVCLARRRSSDLTSRNQSKGDPQEVQETCEFWFRSRDWYEGLDVSLCLRDWYEDLAAAPKTRVDTEMTET
jgi:hypothetical protein